MEIIGISLRGLSLESRKYSLMLRIKIRGFFLLPGGSDKGIFAKLDLGRVALVCVTCDYFFARKAVGHVYVLSQKPSSPRECPSKAFDCAYTATILGLLRLYILEDRPIEGTPNPTLAPKVKGEGVGASLGIPKIPVELFIGC